MTDRESQERMHQENRDLLIEIKILVGKNFEQFTQHISDDAKVQDKLDRSVTALHHRVDNLLVTGVLGIIVVVIAWLLNMKWRIG